MINNEQGKKLSKRDGATDVMEYKTLGYLPEALLNFLVRLGWSHGDQEIFSMDEMIELFEPKNISKSSSNYNLDKLLWLNAHYIKSKPHAELADLLVEHGVDIRTHDKKDLILNATKERGKTLVELAEQINLILDAPTEYNEKNAKKAFKVDAAEILAEFSEMLNVANASTSEEYHAVIEKIVAEKEIGFGKIGMPLRVSLLGAMTGSGLDEIMAILGTEETINRIEKAIKFINA
jgi:glutamyl-tRNA synthetase